MYRVLQNGKDIDSVKSHGYYSDSLPSEADDDLNQSILCLRNDDIDAHLLEHDYCKKTTELLDNPDGTNSSKSNKKGINSRTIKCHLCSFDTIEPEQLYPHIEVEHDGEYMWKCETCLLPFLTEERFNNHTRWCKNSWCKSHACMECNNEKLFVSRQRLVDHIQSKHNGIFPFQCETCSEPLASKFDVECHKVKHDENLLRCCYCGKVCKTVIFREQHMMEHIKNDHTCYICEDIRRSKDNCYNHLFEHVDTVGGYMCHKCEVTFQNKYSLSRHVHQCRREEASLCETCGKLFDNLNAFGHHIRNWHRDETFECDKCGLIYNSKDKLRHHINKFHSSTRTYVCEVCKKTFTISATLKRHLLTHTGEHPFSCDHCDKVFRTKWNLKAHARQHSGEQPYSCSKCGVKFTHNVVRKAHEAKCTDNRHIDRDTKSSPP